MQALFPEGAFFCHALRSLAWTRVAADAPRDGALFRSALDAARRGLDSMESQLDAFPSTEGLSPTHGVFFAGWINWTRGAILSLGVRDSAGTEMETAFRRDCDSIAAAFSSAGTPYLESYPEMSWPSDNVVCIAALRMHDFLYGAKFVPVISEWLLKAKQRLDPVTGMIPYQSHPFDGIPMEGAHGNSQAVILVFLAEIDPVFASEQYRLYARTFPAHPLGLWLAREYPKQKRGLGNIDSGPVLFGVGSAATMVAMAPMRVFGDAQAADAVRSSIDALGLPFTMAGKRRYALGMLPVADAFLSWAETVAPYTGRIAAAPSLFPHKAWRLPFLALSAVIVSLVWAPLLLGRRRARKP